MKPKTPKRKDWICWIEGKRYTLEWRRPPGGDDNGCFEHAKCRILVDPAIHPEQKRDVVMHENTHGISDERNLDLTEAQVTGLGTGLVAWMRANRPIVEWILDPDKPEPTP